MRVTENSNYDTVRNSIQRSKERMDNLQIEATSMRRLNKPSDDPIGTAKVLELRTEKVNNDQYGMNAKMAESFLNNTDQALSELNEIVMRAKEIAIQQASGPSSNDESRLGVAEEVNQLYDQAVAVGNRRVGDRYLFGGYKTTKPPVDPDGHFMGDDGHMMVEIAKDVFLTTNLPGCEAFNTNPKAGEAKVGAYDKQGRAPSSTGAEDSETARNNVNIFDELQNLRIALLTGSMDGVRGTLERFDQLRASITASRAKIGSRAQGLLQTSSALERHNVTNAKLSSAIEDADMAQVMSNLSKEEAIYRSSLATSKHLIQPTLLDFLK